MNHAEDKSTAWGNLIEEMARLADGVEFGEITVNATIHGGRILKVMYSKTVKSLGGTHERN